jgi:hypothetical protein
VDAVSATVVSAAPKQFQHDSTAGSHDCAAHNRILPASREDFKWFLLHRNKQPGEPVSGARRHARPDDIAATPRHRIPLQLLPLHLLPLHDEAGAGRDVS